MGNVIAMPYCGSPAQFQWNAPYSSMPGCQPCPPYPPPCTGPPPLFGPIVGVIDGSFAAPGMVGELIRNVGTVAYAAYPNHTTQVVSLLVVPPGDWDFWFKIWFTGSIGAFDAQIIPVPTGMADNMGLAAYAGSETSVTLESVSLYSFGMGSFSVPTLLPWQLDVWQTTDPSLTAGTAYLGIWGRRRR